MKNKYQKQSLLTIIIKITPFATENKGYVLKNLRKGKNKDEPVITWSKNKQTNERSCASLPNVCPILALCFFDFFIPEGAFQAG